MLKSLFTVVACGVCVGSALASAEATPPPKVEYAEVTGLPCLQPQRVSTDAVIEDFRLAEQRWLSEHYPGRPAPRWETILDLLPSAPGEAPEKSEAFVASETAFVQLAGGTEIPVCFVIGRKSTKDQARK